MTDMPLRFRISKWEQLVDAQSNNSRDLTISVSNFVGRDTLNGKCIRVIHSNYGVLFACVVGAKGSMISEQADGTVFELPPKTILSELEKFGFMIEYSPSKHLSGNQLDYLIQIEKLGFQKLRLLGVWSTENGYRILEQKIVAFNIKENPHWLDNSYSASQEEFISSLNSGSVINLTNISKAHNYDWSWLDYVANISDILEDNA